MVVEHLDDLPLIGHQIKRLRLADLFNEYFPDHGHWQGISGGKLLQGWLLYILSESDHRLSHVEDWASLRLNTLAVLLEEPKLRSLDFCDDRLGRLLDRLSIDDDWSVFEISLGKDILQVYQLQSVEGSLEVIRTDSFNAPQFRETGDLFRHGYSKQRRSDQPFCKVMMSSLDPLALPLAVDIVKGSGPDVDLYLPIISRIQKTLKKPGHVYVGDSQLGSLPNRLAIHLAGDYYLSPLNKKQVKQEELHRYLDRIEVPYQELPSLFTAPGSTRKPAYFFELQQHIEHQQAQCSWTERRILVYSPDYANGLITSFTNRLSEAEEKIEALVVSKKGRRNPKTLKDLHARIAGIIKKYKVEDCFDIEASQSIEHIKVRRHKNRPEEIRQKVKLSLVLKRKEAIISLKKKRLGWQLYGTNIPEEKMATSRLVKIYRDEYKIEHLFDYFINRDVGLLPIYLKKEKRVKALIRLLSLAMKFSMLLQNEARKALKEKNEELTGIYPGNKGRKTTRPTTTMLLAVFRGISTAYMELGGTKMIEMTSLNQTQEKILTLLKAQDSYIHTLKLLKTYPSLRET